MTRPELVKVFLASPGDVAEERSLFSGVLKFFEGLKLGGKEYHFVPLGYEHTLPGAGRPQELINLEQLAQCDIFVMLLWKRWGMPTGKCSSGTKEEFDVALKRFRRTRRPRMLLYFRSAAPDPADEQLRRVLRFKKWVERERVCLYKRYDDPQQWKDLLTRHLLQWLSGSLEEEHDGEGIQRPYRVPAANRQELLRLRREIARANALLKTARGKLRAAAVEYAVEAVRLVGESKLLMAEENFARSIDLYEEPEVLNNYGLFLFQLGSLDRAQEMFKKLLSLTEESDASVVRASAYGNLGLIHSTKGELRQAETMFEKALRTSAALGLEAGLASAYLNLGNVASSRGDLDRAEGMFTKALVRYRAGGHREGLATAYGSLGNVAASRGDLDTAGELYREALRLDGATGRKAAVANTHGNLGNVYLRRGSLARAEQSYRKALRIDKAIGRKEGIADSLLNLGVLHAMRGDFDGARRMQEESLRLNMSLGRIEGMANAYLNLGNLYERQGEPGTAKENWTRAMKLYRELGSTGQVRELKAWLAAIDGPDRSRGKRGGRPVSARTPPKRRGSA